MKFELALTCTLALASTGFAQGVNVDIGTFNAAPSSAFGGAAGQPGFWNPLSATAVGAQPLLDLAGAASPITVTSSATAINYDSNNAGTSGDDELLMDDVAFPTSNITWTINGLAAGSYSVYTYAWAPDSTAFLSTVSVNGGPQTIVGGAWPGGYVAPTTHAVDNVTISAGGSIGITIGLSSGFRSFNGFQIKPNGTASTGFCFGDGTDTACPCANIGLAGRGCDNTVASGGAALASTGSASVGAPTLVLNSTFAVPFGPGLYYEGNATANPTAPFGVTFGNGLRCAGGATNRLEIRFADGTGAANTTVDLQAFGAAVASTTYYYQLWYRDTGNVGTCTPGAGFNFSSGLSLTWGP